MHPAAVGALTISDTRMKHKDWALGQIIKDDDQRVT